MGSGASHNLIDSNYIEIGKSEHALLSNLTYLEQIYTKQRYMAKQLSFGSEQDYKNYIQRLVQRKKLNNKKISRWVIQLEDYRVLRSQEICGHNFKIVMLLEYLTRDLFAVQKQRKALNRPFNEGQVVVLLWDVVNCLATLNDYNYKCHYLSLESIMISEKGNYKVVDCHLTSKMNPYLELLHGIPVKQGTYLAPELLLDLRKENTECFGSPKSDIFTLALIALEMLTLSSFDGYYDYENKTLFLDKLQSNIQSIAMPHYLRTIFQGMTVEDEERRLGPISLQQILSKHLASNSTLNDISAEQVNHSRRMKEQKSNINNTENLQQSQHVASTSSGNRQSESLLAEDGDVPAERTYVAKGITRVTENRKHRSSSNYLSKKSKAADINLKQINHNQQESTNHQIQLRLISQPPVAVLQAHPVLAQHPGAKQHSQGSTSYPKHHAHVVIQNPQIQFTKQQNLLLNGLTEQCNSIPQQASTVVPPASTRQYQFFSNQPCQFFENANVFPLAYQNSEQLEPFSNIPMRQSLPGHLLVRPQEQNTPINYFKLKRQINLSTSKQTDTHEIETPTSKVLFTSINGPPSKRMFGKHAFSNGAVYEGQFNANNEFQGTGVLYYPNGTLCYSGSWKANCFNGYGLLYNQSVGSACNETNYQNFSLNPIDSWKCYEGEFNMDKKEGFGTLYMSNGDKLSGSFNNDFVEGFGTFTILASNKNVNGVWSKNIFRK